MDIVTLAMAKKYTNEQRLGYSEYSYGCVRWDGNTTDKPVISAVDLGFSVGSANYVKITDKVIPVNGITSVGLGWNGTELISLEVDHTEEVDGIFFLYAHDSGLPDVIVMDVEVAEMCGTYVLDMSDGSPAYYVCRIEGNLTETIHPIDPKYLPGVCLPILEMSQETMAGVFASGEAICTEAENEIIRAAYHGLMPLVVKGNFNGVAFSGVSNILLDSSFKPYFEANTGAMTMYIYFEELNELFGAKVQTVRK